MKNVVFFLLLLFSVHGIATSWKKVAENELGSYYVDFDSIKKKRGLIYYSDLIDFLEPFEGNASARNRYAVDCENEKQTWLSFTAYGKSMGKGKVNSRSEPNEVIYPKSNTIYFFIIKNICYYEK